MTRQAFRKSLEELQQDILSMAQMVKTAIEQSVESLKSRDIEWSKKVISNDVLINKKRWEIEEKCIAAIARQQPVASDLRKLVAILNIIVDLERMGDHAEGIAKINAMIGDQPLIKLPIDRMAQKAVDMLDRSLQAFISHDAEAAKAICKEDDEVDSLYDQVFRELLTYMIQDPKSIDRATYLIWAAHNLERIADRVTNICERIVYLATGKMEEIGASKY